MDTRLFIMSENNAVEVAEHYYEQEADLQELIANNPQLLLPQQSSDVHNLYLIQREFSVQESENSANAFSADHLCVDDTGVPTIVEVKRSTNTEIRRKVVAQMLDYACRASSWDVGDLRSLFRKANAGADFLSSVDTDEFWDCVSDNLKKERLRLVFAADDIPDTLLTLIDFLNRSFTSIEAYGVAIKRFESSTGTVISSCVVGAPDSTEPAPVPRQYDNAHSGKWTYEESKDYLNTHNLSGLTPIFDEICSFAEKSGLTCVPGAGPLNPTFSYRISDCEVFGVEAWPRKNKGYVLTVRFWVKKLLKSLNETVDDDKLKQLLSSFPDREAAISDSRLRISRDYVYVDVPVLNRSENMDAFKRNVLQLISMVQRASGTEIAD